MRKPVKPSDKQKEIIKAIRDEIDSWRFSNDLDSPTLRSDIKETLDLFDINSTIRNGLVGSLRILLTQIKNIEDN